MISCRTEERRRKLFRDYEIVPISHVRLLPGQKKTSCAGDVIEKTYFLFELKARINPSKVQDIICGSYAAAHFLKLVDKPAPPLFDPLKTISKVASTQSGTNSRSEKKIIHWDRLNLEFYQALNIFCIAWNVEYPYGMIKSSLKFLQEHPETRTQPRYIEIFNQIVGQDKQGRKLIDMVAELQNRYDGFKNYSFELLSAALPANVTDNFQ